MLDLIQQLDWEKGNVLVPAIIQNSKTKVVLMLGYMNKEALEETLETNKVHFFSRSKKRLWKKGETSGNVLNLISMEKDCDSDALLIQVNPEGPTCHTGNKSCFGDQESEFGIKELYEVIQSRKTKMPESSYTTSLFADGLNRICEKVEEESLEVIQAAKFETKQRLIEESSDLIYHLLVLLAEKGVELDEVYSELRSRKNKSKIKQSIA